jgi:hypothetical protein
MEEGGGGGDDGDARGVTGAKADVKVGVVVDAKYERASFRMAAEEEEDDADNPGVVASVGGGNRVDDTLGHE